MEKNRPLFILLAFGIGLLAVFVVWNALALQAHHLPDDTFANTANLLVTETDDVITFTPVVKQHKAEVIFMQGFLTDPTAYAPLCRQIAENGYTCHLLKLPFRIPQLSYKKAGQLFKLSAGNYIIGGHSQGGKMSAQWVHDNPEGIKGLFLLGTAHPQNISLSNLGIPCLKIYAGHDWLGSPKQVLKNKDKLPAETQLVFIPGGNHARFGYLGRLLVDGTAEITVQEQQEQTLQHLIPFFEKIDQGL